MSGSTPRSSSDLSTADRVELIKSRFVGAVRDQVKTNHAEPEGEGCFTVIAVAALILLTVTIVLIPVALWLCPRLWLNRRHRQNLRDWLAFAERSSPVMGFPLMVNSMLREPGNRQQATGLFLICFEGGKAESIRFMGDIAVRVGTKDRQSMSPEDFDFCSRLMSDEKFRPFRRRRLPETLTDGVTVYAVDLAISPLLLAGGYIHDELPLVPCMAEPGDQGRITQMPYWFISGTPAPGAAEAQEFLVMLGVMSKWTNSRIGNTTP